jgi:hypothetical protein
LNITNSNETKDHFCQFRQLIQHKVLIHLFSPPVGTTYINPPPTGLTQRVVQSTGNPIVYSAQPSTIVATSNYRAPTGSSPYLPATTYGHAGTTTSIPLNQKALTTTTTYSTGATPGGTYYVKGPPVTYTTTDGNYHFIQL